MLRGALTVLLISFALMGQEAPAVALQEEVEPEVVIVNGSYGSLGSTQDGNVLRRGAVSLQIPDPDSFSAERLLNDHGIELGNPLCMQHLCLVSEAVDAQLIAQPQTRYLVGLGLGGELGAARAPVNLVAVVDRSESMQGAPLELTKLALTQLLQQLTPQDQLSIVVYGNTAQTYVPPTAVTPKNRKRLLAAIDRLKSGGAAELAAGLTFGFRLASAAGQEFDGADRVMLFTDERLDVSDTSAGFAALAARGAELGVSLTSVGVSMPYDAAVAATVAGLRGGNSHFLQAAANVESTFAARLPGMLREVAQDVTLTITPSDGYRIAGIYGLPGALLSFRAEQQTLEVTIPTAFQGSTLFISLESDAALPSTQPLAQAAILYTGTDTGAPQTQTLLVMPTVTPSLAMQVGRLLIDEHTTLRRATTAYHADQARQEAFDYLHAFATKLRNSRLAGLDNERRLVNSLEERLAFLSGHEDDADLVRSRISRLWGVWRVRSVQGRTDFRANERIEFTPDSKFRFFEKAEGRHVLTSVANISANRQQILMDYSGVVYNYEVRGSELVLEERPGTLVFLQRSRLD